MPAALKDPSYDPSNFFQVVEDRLLDRAGMGSTPDEGDGRRVEGDHAVGVDGSLENQKPLPSLGL